MTKKVLRLNEYLELPENGQMELLHQDGVHIGKRTEKGQTVILFQLYGFYVEVFYRQYRRVIDHLRTSESTDLLQPYLDQIYVKDLQKNSDGPK